MIGQAARASFTARWETDGSLRFSGRLSAEDGRVLLAALAAVRLDPVREGATDTNRDTETAEAEPDSVQRPDAAARAAHSDAAALIVLAEHALSVPPDAVGASSVRLIVHSTPEASADLAATRVCADVTTTTAATETLSDPSAEGPVVALLDAGPGLPPLPLGPDTLRRLTCQALVEPAARPDAEPTSAVQHRFATSRQRRALLTRHGGCAFPGCPRRRYLHAHHLQPWSEGGPTTMRNLVLTCSHHHRLIHEGGWQLRPRPDQRFDAIRPDGRLLAVGPPAHGDVRQLPLVHDAAIAPNTVTGTWAGEPLELDYAVSVYTQRRPCHT